MTISFSKIQEYLDAIALTANLDVSSSRHGAFWQVTYVDFITGFVPSKICNGSPVPIIDATNRRNSAFFQILQSAWCGMPKMPKTGPFILDPGYSVLLRDGSILTGQQIVDDIGAWLDAGAPE
jgi:hypothetical protein